MKAKRVPALRGGQFDDLAAGTARCDRISLQRASAGPKIAFKSPGNLGNIGFIGRKAHESQLVSDELGLAGTKFGCGMALCGACTVHDDGQATRACVTAISDTDGRAVVTIEGLDPDGNHPVQKAWRTFNVPQCGYCQAGQIMQAAALLATSKNLSMSVYGTSVGSGGRGFSGGSRHRLRYRSRGEL